MRSSTHYRIALPRRPHPSRLRRATFPKGEGFWRAALRRKSEGFSVSPKAKLILTIPWIGKITLPPLRLYRHGKGRRGFHASPPQWGSGRRPIGHPERNDKYMHIVRSAPPPLRWEGKAAATPPRPRNPHIMLNPPRFVEYTTNRSIIELFLRRANPHDRQGGKRHEEDSCCCSGADAGAVPVRAGDGGVHLPRRLHRRRSGQRSDHHRVCAGASVVVGRQGDHLRRRSGRRVLPV